MGLSPQGVFWSFREGLTSILQSRLSSHPSLRPHGPTPRSFLEQSDAQIIVKLSQGGGGYTQALSGQVMAHKGCQRRLRGRVDKHAVHMYRQDISPPGCIAFTPSPLTSPPSSLTHGRPDSRAKSSALSKSRHVQPKDESIPDHISSLPDRIRKWVNQRRHAPARTFQALVCPLLDVLLLHQCTLPAILFVSLASSSSVSRGGFVCHRQIISAASRRCKSKLAACPRDSHLRHFLPDCSP